MTKVYSALNGMQVHNVKNALEAQGVECVVRGENLRVAQGELPIVECWTELWVVDDARADDARRIIADADAGTGAASGEPWTCPGCGESVEAQFTMCWNCEADRPATK